MQYQYRYEFIPLNMQDITKHTPMMQHYMSVKKEFPEYILFYRMGDFFEIFWEDAQKIAPLLDLNLTFRGVSAGKKIPMAGVPAHATNPYLKKLLNMGISVAVCDQVGAVPKQGLVKREVTRILTPGTIHEADFLDENSESITCAIAFDGQHASNSFAVAWMDISCGKLWVSEFNDFRLLGNELQRRSAAEIVVSEVHHSTLHQKMQEIGINVAVKSVPAWFFDQKEGRDKVEQQLKTDDLAQWNIDHLSTGMGALGALISYGAETNRGNLTHLNWIQYENQQNQLILDEKARKALAIQKHEEESTLYDVLNQCSTPMGKRLLRQWLQCISNDSVQITARLDCVSLFVTNQTMARSLKEKLHNIRDIERILTRISLRSVNPKELLDLAMSWQQIQGIYSELDAIIASLPAQDSLLKQLHANLSVENELITKLSKALVDPAPSRVVLGNFIKPGYCEQLDSLKLLANGATDQIEQLRDTKQQALGLSKLKIGSNRVLGMYYEITKSQPELPAEFNPVAYLKTSVRYSHPDLQKLHSQMLQADEKVSTLEKDLYDELVTFCNASLEPMWQTARSIAMLDVLINFAELAVDRNYVRPEFHEGIGLYIEKMRHPVVELAMPNSFVTNDITLNSEQSTVLITGPNMGGKSTYMRAVALNVIIAHLGSFVPANSASIGKFTQIYTRIGSGDLLSKGLSTFMVEMQETAKILNASDPHSLVLLDEIGRGTGTADGLAIARAVCEAVTGTNRAMCLFATHFTEITSLALTYPQLINMCFRATKRQKISFDYKISSGVAPSSYGIEVADLAGIPEHVVQLARQLFDEANHQHVQPNLFDSSQLVAEPNNENKPTSAILSLSEALAQLNIDELTPKQAMNELYNLKKIIDSDENQT